jgi:hypothetical protein
LELYEASKAPIKLFDFYPQDINSTQVEISILFMLINLLFKFLNIKTFEVSSNENNFDPSDSYRLHFVKLTDFFGRLIIYNLQLYGSVESN